jgi:hypothetical protein
MHESGSRGRKRRASLPSRAAPLLNLFAFISAELLLEDLSAAALLLGLGLVELGIWFGLRSGSMGFHSGECLFLASAFATSALLRSSGVPYPRLSSMEGCLLVAMLLSSLIGYPLVGNLLRRSIGITPRNELERGLSRVLLVALLVHLLLIHVAAVLLPGGSWLVPVAALPPAVVLALIAGRRLAAGVAGGDGDSKRGVAMPTGVVARRSNEQCVKFLRGSEPVGSCRLGSGRVCDVLELRVDEECDAGEILHALECLCISEGARAVRIMATLSNASWDEELRAAGFLELEDGWRKVIPLTSYRSGRSRTE